MRALLVFDHPYGAEARDNVPHDRSLSAALLASVDAGLRFAGHTVTTIDLAADGFSPTLTSDDLRAWRLDDPAPDALVRGYQTQLAEAELLVFVFPTWWMGMPAATKGFLDRVLTRGFAFDEPRIGGALVNRLTRLRSVAVVTPMTTPAPLYRSWFAAPAQRILFRGTFGLIGIRRLLWITVGRSTQRGIASRKRVLRRIQSRFSRF